MASEYLPRYTSSYALIIGIDSYNDPNFSALGEAESDGKALAELLGKDPFNFTVTTLLGQQATRQAVLGELHKLRNAGPDDRVLVFFSGHGYTIPDNFGKETGYLAAYDTVFQQDFTALEVDDVTALRLHAKAKHVAFIFDCCYSGQALGLTRAASSPNLAADKYLSRRAYQAVSAGASVVADYRSMTRSMVTALKEGRVAAVNGIFTLSRLGLYLKESLASSSGHKQIPEFGHLEGSQGGDFILWMDTGPRLPDDLEASLHSTRPNTRLGAIVDLIEIAKGSDHDLALLARARLERVRKTDPDDRVKIAAQSFFDEERAQRLGKAGALINAKQGGRLVEEAQEEIEEAQEAREISSAVGSESDPKSSRPEIPTFSDIPVRKLSDNPISSTELQKISPETVEKDKAARLQAAAASREQTGKRDNTANKAVADMPIPDLSGLKRKAEVLDQARTRGAEANTAAQPASPAGQVSPVSGGLSSTVWMIGGAVVVVALIAGGVVFSGALNPPPTPTPTPTEAAVVPTTEVAVVLPPADTPTPEPPTLTPTPGPTATPTLIGGGGSGMIAWVSKVGSDFEIMLSGSAGLSTQQITFNNASDISPAWSPDGSTIAFTTDRDGNDEVYLMGFDGSNQRPISRNPARDFSPSWSPDGKRIAFASTRNGNEEIYVMQADGTRTVRLTFDNTRDYDPAWSPDGKWIAFVSERDLNPELYVVSADGTEIHRLTSSPASDTAPFWAADSASLLFTSDRDGRNALFLLDVASAIADPNTAVVTRVSRGVLDDYEGVFSPDNQMIAFVTRRDGNAEIYLMARDGSGLFRLTENVAEDTQPAWKP